MKWLNPPAQDPCPKSAVSHGVGLAGLFGLAIWVSIASQYQWSGPNASLVSVFCVGVPMVLWSVLVDKVHRNPSTGLDWSHPKPIREIIDISQIKLIGLWTTWAIIGTIYFLLHYYWVGSYLYAMQVFTYSAPILFLGSIPYVIWIDRVMVKPHDSLWHFGMLVTGQPGWNRERIARHWRSWAVKGFFIAFMLSGVPIGYMNLITETFAIYSQQPGYIWEYLADPVRFVWLMTTIMFVIDMQIAMVGYVLTVRPLDSHIRTANPYLGGWLAALICYPPFIMMGPDRPIYYSLNTQEWMHWLLPHEFILGIQNDVFLWGWAIWLVFLTAIYAWATVAFGLRFSNLTHRGILTHGPYRWTKHPAYVSKNTYWWFAYLPFLVTSGSVTEGMRNAAMLGVVSAIYYWRARTEEKHLMSDPAYQEYAAWMERNSPIPRLVARLTLRDWRRRKFGPHMQGPADAGQQVSPAE